MYNHLICINEWYLKALYAPVQDDIKSGMFSINPGNTNGLLHNFHFSAANVKDVSVPTYI